MDGARWGSWIPTFITAVASLGAAYTSVIATREASGISAQANIAVENIRKENADRQSDIEMVKLALNILGGEISDKTRESRNFAVSLLRKYSGVTIDEKTGTKWAEAGTVSFALRGLGLASSADQQAARGAAALLNSFGNLDHHMGQRLITPRGNPEQLNK